MNWGVRILLALALFVIAAVSAGIYMVNKNVDTIEDVDYYEKGLTYDERYDRKENTERLQARPEVITRHDTLTINFVHGNNTGELYMMRPSDENQDIRIPFAMGENTFKLPLSTLSRGSWKLVLEWESDGTGFYHEQNLYL